VVQYVSCLNATQCLFTIYYISLARSPKTKEEEEEEEEEEDAANGVE
jgi:hypothetical protein